MKILTPHYLTLTLITILFLPLNLGLTEQQQQLIDQLINDSFIPQNKVTGMSLAIVENGKSVYSKGYGKQDIENGIDATNNTLFLIGSVTKSFTATIVVKILSAKFPTEGEAVLDRSIVSFKPKFNFTLNDRYRSEQTTFRDLLSHRGCSTSHDLELVFGTMKTIQEYNYRTRYQPEACGFRTKFVYNNGLYSLAGELIADIAGIPLEQLMREFMLEIGMQNSTLIDQRASYEDLPNMSQAYFQKDGQIQRYNRTAFRRLRICLGTGGIISTSTDMGKYMEFHLNKGKVGDKQIVSEEALSWLTKSSIHTAEISSRTNDESGPTGFYAYGLGLALGIYNGYAFYGHNGFYGVFQSELQLYHYGEKNVGVFLVSNGPGLISGNLTQEIVGNAVFDIVRTGTFNKKLSPVTPNQPQAASSVKPALKVSGIESSATGEFGDMIGMYGNDSGGDLIIKADSEDPKYLQINYGEWGIGRLLPTNASTNITFLVDWKTDVAQHWYGVASLVPNIPIFHINFHRVNLSVEFIMNDISLFTFRRNATLETFPIIPWNPSSCGP